MNLLVISSVLPPVRAGEADYALHLLEHLSTLGWNQNILTSKAIAEQHIPGCQFFPLMKNWSWKELPRLVSFLKNNKPDAILLLYIGWIYRNHPMITSMPKVAKELLPDIPIVTLFYNAQGANYHENHFLTRLVGKTFLWWAGRKRTCYEFGNLLSDSDHLIVFCQHHKDKILCAHPPSEGKISILPPPPILRICRQPKEICRKEMRDRLGYSEKNFVFCFFGRMYPGKGIEILIPAFAKVVNTNPEARLLLIGGDLDETAPHRNLSDELHSLAQSLGVVDKIHWSGNYSSDSDKASQYLYASDTAVFPFWTGIALNNSSVAAAAFHGLPIISTWPAQNIGWPAAKLQRPKSLRHTLKLTVSSIEDAYIHRRNVLLHRPSNIEELFEAMQSLMLDKELRETLIKGSLELAEKHHSWDNLMKALRGIFAQGDQPKNYKGQNLCTTR